MVIHYCDKCGDRVDYAAARFNIEVRSMSTEKEDEDLRFECTACAKCVAAMLEQSDRARRQYVDRDDETNGTLVRELSMVNAARRVIERFAKR